MIYDLVFNDNLLGDSNWGLCGEGKVYCKKDFNKDAFRL